MTTQQQNTEAFTLAWGKHTFERKQSQVHTFHYSREGTTTFVNKVLTACQRMRKTWASTDGYEDHGAWYEEAIYSADGALLLLKAQESFQAVPRAQAGVFLELNQHAPLVRINVKLSPHRLAAKEDIDAFIGRAFILSPEEVRARGYKVRDSFINNFFDQEEIDELVEVEELMEGAEKPAVDKVTDSSGEEKTVLIAQQPKRKLKMRRSNVSHNDDQQR